MPRYVSLNNNGQLKQFVTESAQNGLQTKSSSQDDHRIETICNSNNNIVDSRLTVMTQVTPQVIV